MTTIPHAMHSAAPALPRDIPRQQRARARHLRVAEAARRRRRARLTVWLSALLAALAVFVLVAFHVFAVQHAFAVDELAEQRRVEELRYERLRAEVATRSSPPVILDGAKHLGMQAPPTVEYIEAPAAAGRPGDTDRTSSTLVEVHGEAKQSLDP